MPVNLGRLGTRASHEELGRWEHWVACKRIRTIKVSPIDKYNLSVSCLYLAKMGVKCTRELIARYMGSFRYSISLPSIVPSSGDPVDGFEQLKEIHS